MAQLKDLIVSGVTRCLGKLYASELVGKLTGTADRAIADNNGSNIANTYIKNLELDQATGKTITFTYGNNSTNTITISDTIATDQVSGVVKIYSTTGQNTDGTMTQQAISNAINGVYSSPAFTGTPTAPTVSDSEDNTTKIATTAFVQAAIQKAIEDLFENGTFIASAAIANYTDQLVTAGDNNPLTFLTDYPIAVNDEETDEEENEPQE